MSTVPDCTDSSLTSYFSDCAYVGRGIADGDGGNMVVGGGATGTIIEKNRITLIIHIYAKLILYIIYIYIPTHYTSCAYYYTWFF